MRAPHRSFPPFLTAATALYAVVLAACTAPGSTIEEIDDPIVGGTRQTACQWPTAVGAGGCTNTLVHPRIVTTANHCVGTGGARAITFGETWTGAGVVRRVMAQRCYGAASSGVRGDFGFCVLAEPVTDVPIVPIIYGCETEILKPGQKAVLVGYGKLNGGAGGAGIKYAVNVDINRISGNDISVGNAQSSACNGDSGGPAYVKLADGTWRVFGATSRGSAGCNAATIYTLIHPFVAWMERTSMIDVTPCHDADGTWNPGPECGSFPTNPDQANGTWQTMCNPTMRGGLSATCGAPYGGGPVPDSGAPGPTDSGTPVDGRRDGLAGNDARDGGARDTTPGVTTDAVSTDSSGPSQVTPDSAPPSPDLASAERPSQAPVDASPPSPPPPPPPPPPPAPPPPAPPAPPPSPPAPPPPGPAPGGCSCSAPGTPQAAGTAPLSFLAGLTLLVVARRGRRRR